MCCNIHRWEDIVKDLTCEMPKYFNIRHTERGILSKNSKRTGKNLHCIMAFKKLQDSLTTLLFDNVDSEDDMSSQSEVEELDSSDSDVSTSTQGCSGGGQHRDKNKSYTDGVGVDVCDHAQSYSVSKLTPAFRGMSSSDSDYNAEVESEHEQSYIDFPATGGAGVRRSGTFTKERPTLNLQQTRSLSSDLDSDCSVDAEDNANLEGGGMKRSSTFTKDLAECTDPLATCGDENGTGVMETNWTKETHTGESVCADEDLLTHLQNIDLDETLKDSDFI